MARIGLAVFSHDHTHMAVGTGKLRRRSAHSPAVNGTLTQEGLKLRVLNLNLPDTGTGILIIVKSLAGIGHFDVIIKGAQDRVRMHTLEIVAGKTGHTGTGREVILHMALTAGQIRRRDAIPVFPKASIT